MLKSSPLFRVLLFVPTIIATNGYSDNRVVWTEDSQLTDILLSADGLPGLTIEGAERSGERPSVSFCETVVYRPKKEEPAIVHPDHKLECKFGFEDGSDGSLRLDLADVGIEAWGSRFEKLPFSIQFYTDGRGFPLAYHLYEAFQTYYRDNQDDPGLLEGHTICGPDGRECVVWYALSRKETPDGAAAIICSANLEWDQSLEEHVLYKAGCTFLPLARDNE